VRQVGKLPRILLMNKENCALKLVDEIMLYYDVRSQKHQTNKTLLNYFPASKLRMPAHHLPGKNRKIWGVRLILHPCPEHSRFASVSVGSWIVIIFCSLVLQVSKGVHRTHNSAIYKSS